ncbi:MAG: oligopeptide/dipeptide ABC transporter ATP-binding protein [Acutalibacteraceae bacterium]
MFIAHDLAIVRYISDKIGVLYHGKLVEIAPTEELFENPVHPYTKSLLSAVPTPNPRKEKNKVLVPFDGNSLTGKEK